MKRRFARVAVNSPLKDPLTYIVPESLPNLDRGMSVHLPLGRRQAVGVVVSVEDATDVAPELLKSITSLNEERPHLSEAQMKWLEWISNYYVYPLGQTIELSFPPLPKAGRKKTSDLNTLDSLPHLEPELTEEQKAVVESIKSGAQFQTHLLFGVTGAGKTEVYLQLLKRTLSEGKKALMLVPEISLTPQVISRFSARFGDRVAVLHSHLTSRDRTIQWWEIQEGKKDILIGARSALFCPIPNLGLIIVDEEHEPSYKQEEKLKYHGRDAAIVMGQLMKCPVILGSATPSLESWQNALTKKYQLHTITKRATSVAMPEITVKDLRTKTTQPDEKQKYAWASDLLLQQVKQALDNKEQAALFLNRRGMAQVVLCPGCGAKRDCPNCSISLVLHSDTYLVCHYCDYQESMPEVCPSCNDSELRPVGLGTELVEKDIQKVFPDARVLRADRDEIQNRQELEEFIRKVEAREADIIVGTQMIAKGLDFPHLSLVGVVLADVAMNIPDFRASERAYQLLSQVSGRAGRKSKQGTVIIQTFNPDHPSVVFSKTHDFQAFASQELQARQELGYPPFGRLLLARFQGLNRRAVEEGAEVLAERLSEWARTHAPQLEILGPSQSPIFRVRNNYRYHLLLKSPKDFSMSKIGWLLMEQEASLPKGVRILIDVDPLSML